MGFLLKEEKEKLLIEYNLLREEVWERGYRTGVINAILIIGSLLVAFVQAAERFVTPALSLVLVVTALILYTTSERVNAVAYERLQEIEVQLRITGLKRMYESRIVGKWWFLARKNVLYVLFTVLASFYLFLMFDVVYVFVFAVVVGLLAIVLLNRKSVLRAQPKKVPSLEKSVSP